ncbi:MAG: pyridoxamine 5'-phosphate oxidase family protein [Lachnospiraceae bacterium]|nr:pyridoxamine 5'-phosphate oxidase family protein [Lachnospiraceae bacterium]
MSMACDFLKECGVFYVLTLNGDFPAGRPFGAVMEHEGDLYISTGDMKDVYKQLKLNPNMQIIAQKPGSRSWLRIDGIASECTDMVIKEKMLDECPSVQRNFPDATAMHYVVFKIKIVECKWS